MFPARILFPAIVSLVSGLWALAEWRDQYESRDVIFPVSADPGETERYRQAMEERQAVRDAREERKLRLAEAREARLRNRTEPDVP